MNMLCLGVPWGCYRPELGCPDNLQDCLTGRDDIVRNVEAQDSESASGPSIAAVDADGQVLDAPALHESAPTWLGQMA